MLIELNKKDFTVSICKTGYMIYYLGEGVCGVTTMPSNYDRKRTHWRNIQADLKMYHEQSKREIESIIMSGKNGQYYERIFAIQNQYVNLNEPFVTIVKLLI